MSDEPAKQPLLPRIGILWLFILITLVAIALGVVQAADQGLALSAAMVFVLIFLVVFLTLSAFFFGFAFAFGSLEDLLDDRPEEVASPFSDGSLPEQIIPPRNVNNE